MDSNANNHNNQAGTPFDLNAWFRPSNMAAQNPSNFPNPSSSTPVNPNPGARLMALLSGSSQENAPMPPVQPSCEPAQPLSVVNEVSQTPPLRLRSRKVPSGRRLAGERVVYDVDVRLQGELQPELEVTPITKYHSVPTPVLGRQVAVNRKYICYWLKTGSIRVIDINTGGRSLLRGHTQRVTDMAFFAENIHLLASASIDGRVYVWKISEGEGTQEFSGNVVVSIHIIGDKASRHPRVCWHCHKTEILVLAIGKNVLRIDTAKVGKGRTFTEEEPLQCPLDKLIHGVELVGKHDGEVTDLSMCQWMTTLLVSSSKDGTIKIWEDQKSQPLVVLKPHDGLPVDAAMFLRAPHSREHIILLTAGPQNREVKLWALLSKDGRLPPSDSESLQCIQTLELNSSAERRIEEAFFNQVVGLSQAGLLLLANAKKNSIYAVHLEYGANPAATRMDYLAEFTVTMPILSFTGTYDVVTSRGEEVVRVYCVQTQVIQQYTLDLSQCLPPPMENFGWENSEPSVYRNLTEGVSILDSSGENSVDAVSAGIPGGSNPIHQAAFPQMSPEIKLAVGSPSVPFRPTCLRKPSDLCVDQLNSDYLVDRHIDNGKLFDSLHSTESDSMIVQAEVTPPAMFKHSPYLVTPSEIMATTSSDTTHVAESKSEVEAKIQKSNLSTQVEPQIHIDRKEAQNSIMKVPSQPSKRDEEVDGTMNNTPGKSADFGASLSVPYAPAQTSKSMKQEKNSQGSGLGSSSQIVDNSADALNHTLRQIASMQKMMNQLVTAQQEIRKQMLTTAAAPVKESRRLEVALGRSIEKAGKVNSDILWARIQEEIAKLDRLVRERTQQMTSLVTNCFNKDLMPVLDKTLKKEMAAVATNVARTITPAMEKSISSAIADAFQKGVGDKAVNQLEKSFGSRVEAIIARQIQVQFQTTGKQALQEGLKSILEANIVPAFQMSCKAMFEQVDASFRNGMAEHIKAAHQQIESSHSPLAMTLRETINSASSITQSLNGELAEQRKLSALAAARANSNALLPLSHLITNPLVGLHNKVEQPYDPTIELSRLISEHKYEEAFTTALQRNDVSIVSWLCSQVDLQRLLSNVPLLLSQGVLLSLLQQLTCDITNETPKKLHWMTDVAAVINPSDPMIVTHVRAIFEQVYQTLNHRLSLPSTSPTELTSIRVVMHVINSMLLTCK